MLRRATAVWLVLIGVEFVHGVLRTLFLVPRIGDFRSRQVGVFTGSLLILLVAYLSANWLRGNAESLIRIGLLWVGLTVAFELLFGHFAFGRSWASLREDFDLAHGGLMPLGLAILASAPLIAARLRRL
jgi:hypothetical protein